MLKIVKYPHKALRKKTKPIKTITPKIVKFSQELMKTLVPKPGKPLGVGLAATQVNHLYRLFIIKMPDEKFEVCINPEIIKSSKKMLSDLPEKDRFLEGCLSIPDYYTFVNRPLKIKVKYQTTKGLAKTRTLIPPFSSYFSHELDHINGVLFIDHLKKSPQQLYLANKTDKKKLDPVDNPFA